MSESNATQVEAKTFDVLGTVKGTTYPTKDVPVFTDQESAHQIAVLDAEANETLDADRVNELDEQIAVLRDKIKATVLTFHLRGIGRGVRVAVQQKVKQTKFGEDENARNLFTDASYLAEHIVRVTNADGAVDEHIWSPEQAQELILSLPDEEAQKLLSAMMELTFQAAYFEGAVGADFLPKS